MCTCRKPRTKPWYVYIILVFIVISVCTPNASARDNDLYTRIDAFIRREMNTGNIPGIAVGIVRGDDVVYLKGYGTAGPGKGDVTPETNFILGSVSKSFTGLAIMQLAEKGFYKLTDPVVKYLPWFIVDGSEGGNEIEIVHLLNHTSGIPASAGNDSGIERGDTIEERIMLKGHIELNNIPGTVFEYSSLNYDILGALIQKVSHLTYNEYIRKYIFEPLKMDHSYASLDDLSIATLATGYVPWFGCLVPMEIRYSNSALPSGYIISSVHDMTRYLMAFTDCYEHDTKLLNESDITLVQESIGNTAYGAGWYSGGYYKWHTGELANYNAYICTIPSENLGIIVLSNTNDIGIKFLNSGSSSLKRIPEGIRILLMGGDIHNDTVNNVKNMYILVDLVIAIIVFIVIRFLLWQRPTDIIKRRISYKIKALAAVSISPVLFWGISSLIGASWLALMVSVPDLTLAALIISALILVSGIINTAILIREKLTNK